jgi:glycosyltransferase A (GT-A) superfamily protein (DUF2064 family)
MLDSQRPTLLVFTLGPGREHARRRWLGEGFAQLEHELHERCLQEVLAAGREAGCTLRVCSPAARRLAPDAELDCQSEAGFGGRLLGAVRRASAGAPGPLIVVGTDTPGLDSGLLEQALETLECDPSAVVLGPAKDGGIYLLAAAQPIADELEHVAWCNARTLDSLVAALSAAGRPVRLLPQLSDLDCRRDLEQWVAGRFSAPIAAGWHDLVAALRAALVRLAYLVVPPPPPVLAPVWQRSPLGRAPPR